MTGRFLSRSTVFLVLVALTAPVTFAQQQPPAEARAVARSSTATSFAENVTISGVLTDVASSSVAWGDYDNDGDLDILLTGVDASNNRIRKVYENDPVGTFTEEMTISGLLAEVGLGSVAWGDYDNDGDLDILLTGRDAANNSVSKVYENDPVGTFTEEMTISGLLADVGLGSVAWGDYDNDGDLDLLLTGRDTSNNPVSAVYENDGSGGFAENTAVLTDVAFSSVAWGDYDNDGDLDILLTGFSASGQVSEVYENDGSGGFAENTDISSVLTDITTGSVAWGDYDNDGDLDILLTGGGSSRVSKVYENDPVGTFTDAGISLTGVEGSSVAWGDYDNDGDLDILLTGEDASLNEISTVYENDGSGGFTEETTISGVLTDVRSGSVAWGDYDNDGDLDILLTGRDAANNPVSKVYDNDGSGSFPVNMPSAASANTPPTAPTNLAAAPTDTAALLSWDAASDTETPTDGLAYTLRIGTTPGGFDVLAPMSIVNTTTGAGKTAACSPDCPEGYRKIVSLSPVRPAAGGGSPSWQVEGLTPGTTYHWSVQALDGAWAGGAFAAEGSFTTTSPFTENTAISSVLTDVELGSVAWGDYDNDGDLDILLTGSASSGRVSAVYDNDGSGGFTENIDISSVLTGVSRSSVAWGDYDNDGDLDILLTGEDAGGDPVSAVYDNDGSGGFTDAEISLTGVERSSVAWGDYDNDGDLDILLTGENASFNPVSEVYENDGSGGFAENTDISSVLTDVVESSVAWGDYDNDGNLDILLTGNASSGRVSAVYDNDGSGGFTENIDISGVLTGVAFSSVAWGDYDNDGDLDILLTGRDASFNEISEVYENDGSGGFTVNTDISSVLTGVRSSSVAWGDYDNDGDLDILLTGRDVSSNEISKVYENNGSGGFTENTDISSVLTGVANSSVAWGDYDNDGDLDILLIGFDEDNDQISKVYENVGGFPANTPPAAPTNLAAAPTDTAALLSWDAATDTETPTDGLAYTLRIGTTPGGFDVLAPMSIVNTTTGAGKTAACSPDCPEGYRKIVSLSPVRPAAGGGSPSWQVEGLTPGMTYHWSVQALDGAWAGGAFAAEGSFTTSPFIENTAISGVLKDVESGSVAWGDYDNDGDLDLLLTGSDGSSQISKVYENDGSGGFTDAGISLTGVEGSSVAWGDYDNDGDLDILLTGFDGTNRVSKVYENDPVGTFTEETTISGLLADVRLGSVAWGDYDNDGDLDILLTGVDASGNRISAVYENDGSGGFTEATAISGVLTDVEFSSVAWGDYDNDGDLDILLTGFSASGRVSAVYENDGSGGFTENTVISSVLTGVSSSSVAWGDYDNDGDLDILLTGFSASGQVSKVYENDPVGTFTDAGISLTGVQASSVAWGDYDNDGDLDILLTGFSASGRVSAVYENDGSGGFTENTDISSVLTDVEVSSVAWGDYDNDGDLDILLTGFSASGRVSKVYENIGGFPVNTPPAAPTNLAAAPTDTAALLSWDAATDTETPTDGLAYTLRIGTTPGGFDVMAPMSIVNTTTGAGKTAACSPDCPEGYRKIVSLSPVRPAAGGGRGSWQVGGLTPGTTYHWSVQALDGAWAGGAFAAEGSFATSTGTTTRYVSTTGSDTGNTCLVMASPCRTVGHAVGQAQAGDTIQVAAGTYAEPGLVIDKAVLFAGAGIVIQ